MAHSLQQTVEDSGTAIQPGQQFTVRRRFFSLSAGQELEVVDVSSDRLPSDGLSARLTLQLTETTPSCAASTMDYHSSDIQRALDRGVLERQ